MKSTLQKNGKFIDDQIGVLLLLPLFSHTFSPVLSPNFVFLTILLLLFARSIEGNLHETIKAKFWIWREPFILLLAAFMAMIVINLFFSEKLMRDFQLGFWNFIIPVLLCIATFMLARLDAKSAIYKNSRITVSVFIFTAACLVLRLYFHVPIDYPIMHQAPAFDPQYDPLYNHAIIGLVLIFFPIAMIVCGRSGISNLEKIITTLTLLIAISIVLILGKNHSARFAFAFGLIVCAASIFFNRFIQIELLIFIPVIIFLQPFWGGFVLYIFQDGYFEYFKATFEQRAYIWTVYGPLVFEAPAFGHGLGSTEYVNVGKIINDRFQFDISGNYHPHNNFLQIWYEFGIVGISLIIIAINRLLTRVGMQSVAVQSFYLGFFVTCFSIALVSHGLWQAWWIIVILTSGLLFRLTFEWHNQKKFNASDIIK